MVKKITSIVIDENQHLSFHEFCQLTSADESYLIEMINYGVLDPEGETAEDWQFSFLQLRRYQQAEHLQHDLQLNLSGVALSLDLLEQLRTLRERIKKLEHQLKLSGQG